jgi:hypothetical protein
MKPCKKQAVSVTFLDHASWVGEVEAIKPMTCEVVGYLVHEDGKYYRIVSWIAEGNLIDNNNEGYAILKSAVTKVRRFK